MRGRGVWRAHGSADEFTKQLTGREWIKIFKYMKKRYLFYLTCLFNVFGCVSPYVLSLIQGKLATILVDTYYSSGESFLEAVNQVSNELLFAVLIILAFNLAQFVAESYFMPQFLKDLKVALMDSIMSQDMSFFDQTETGLILSRITDDVENAHSAYTERLLSLLRVVVQWSTGLIVSLTQSTEVTLISCACLPFYALTQHLGNKKVDALWNEYNDCSTAVSTKAEEILTSFRTVRSFDAEMREYRGYKERLMAVHDVVKRNSYIQGTKEFFSTLIHWGMAALVLWVTGRKAANKEIEPGSIVVFMSILNNWSFAFSGIFSSITEFKKSNVSAAKILEITERQPLIDAKAGRHLDSVKGRIEFRDVTFTYPSRDTPAVKGLSFVVEPNTTVAIVGESGCGKSTTLQLLERFYDVSSGAVLVDGIDIREVAPESLRKFIAFVPQAPAMFSMSVKNNIRFGKPGAHRDEVVGAARIANADGFIRQLSDGYSTEVQQNSLSGGQKQRICIARAVMMDAPILLMDEATAALDAESESLVQEAISKYRVGKTAIIVAHRLSTVRHADVILVMDQGHIVESGTHEQLIEKDGAYAQLVKHQLQ